MKSKSAWADGAPEVGRREGAARGTCPLTPTWSSRGSAANRWRGRSGEVSVACRFGARFVAPGRARMEVSQPRVGSQLCRPSAGDGAARTHPNVDEGNRAGDEAERGPQQTLLTHNGHQRAITASAASERPHRVNALKLNSCERGESSLFCNRKLSPARGSGQFARARRWRSANSSHASGGVAGCPRRTE